MSKEIEYEVKQKTLKVQEVAELDYTVDQRFTYEDYCTWPNDQRWELIDGKAFKMEAPNRYHQKISGTVFAHLYFYLQGKPCEVYAAPFDVRLNVGEGKDTVVQPDIVVICDREKLDRKGAKGAPEFVIEILSRSTFRHDQGRKFEKYEQYGVKEYWIVDPVAKVVTVYILNLLGEYEAMVYKDGDAITSKILRGFRISVKDIFADE